MCARASLVLRPIAVNGTACASLEAMRGGAWGAHRFDVVEWFVLFCGRGRGPSPVPRAPAKDLAGQGSVFELCPVQSHVTVGGGLS